jgi:chemotaxis methyl-accepting protein methylase
VSERDQAISTLFELLELRHGIGTRAAWAEARLARALDALVDEAGDANRALELVRSDAARLCELADLLRVGETSFYRDPPQWEALRRVVLPRLRPRDRLRAASVGCSTGEEAWTLAMLLDETATAYRVVGLDRSEAALATAREAAYPLDALRNLPADLVARYLTQDRAAGRARVAASLAPNVSFVARDVMNGLPPGSYDVVVCKNLLIYLGGDSAERVVQLLLRGLSGGGALIVARSEVPRLRALGARAEEVGPGITVFRA